MKICDLKEILRGAPEKRGASLARSRVRNLKYGLNLLQKKLHLFGPIK